MSNNTTLAMPEDEQNSKIEALIAAFRDGMDSLKRAGDMLVELVEADPHVYDYIIARCPGMTAGVLQNLEKIGRGLLLPSLASDSSPGGMKLKGLPLSAQSRYETEPVPLIIESAEGTDVLLVKVRDMTRDQARQVFGNGRLRTEGEQKAWLVDARAKAARSVNPTSTNTSPWKIKAGRVEFVAGASLSAGELATIITQLTR